MPKAEVIRFLINLLLRPPVLVVAWRQVHVGSLLHRVAQALLVPRSDPRHGSKYCIPTDQGLEERACDVQQDGGEKPLREQCMRRSQDCVQGVVPNKWGLCDLAHRVREPKTACSVPDHSGSM